MNNRLINSLVDEAVADMEAAQDLARELFDAAKSASETVAAYQLKAQCISQAANTTAILALVEALRNNATDPVIEWFGKDPLVPGDGVYDSPTESKPKGKTHS